MALSQKTVELDSITVETLFNRGFPFSTSQTYMPIVSYTGPYIPIPSSTQIYVSTFQQEVLTSNLGPYVATFAGGGSIGGRAGGYLDSPTGIYALFSNPHYVTVDSNQNLYVSDSLNDRIRKISPSGNVTTFFDTSFPTGLCIDSQGNIYVVTTNPSRILKISPSGQILTNPFASGFNFGQGLAIDLEDNIYIADNNQYIKKITPSGQISILAGNGTVGTNTGIGANAQFNFPRGLCLDTLGNLYVADYLNFRICKINIATSNVTILAGNSTQIGPSNGIGTNVAFGPVFGLVFDNLSNIYVSDNGNDRNHVRKINIFTSNVSVFVGSGQGRNDGVGTNAQFFQPRGLALDTLGNMYIADTANQLIRKVAPTGVSLMPGNVTTLAGGGGGTNAGYDDETGTNALFYLPFGVAVDSTGNIYVADSRNNIIRKITSGIVTTLAGGGGGINAGYTDAIGTNALFRFPSGVAVDSTGNVYVADTNNNLIRKISPGGVVTTLAGGTNAGYTDATGTNSRFDTPRGITLDSTGNIYVADTNNNLIRKITSGVVTTLAGGGGGRNAGYTDATGTNALFRRPNGVTVDSTGNIYVGEFNNNLIRKITSGVVTTLAGKYIPNGLGSEGGYADATGTNARFNNIRHITIDLADNIYVADANNNLIRKITPSGQVTTLAGNGDPGYADGNGIFASFRFPYGIALDSTGNIYIGDSGNNLIRVIAPTSVIAPISDIQDPNVTTFKSGISCFGLALDTLGNIYVSNYNGGTIGIINIATGYVSTISIYGENPLALDTLGNLYFIDNNNGILSKINLATQEITIVRNDIPSRINNALAIDNLGNIYVVYLDSIYRVTNTTKTLIYSISGTEIYALAVDSQNLYAFRYTFSSRSNSIIKINLSTNNPTVFNFPYVGSSYGLAVYNNILYISDNTNHKIYTMDVTNGNFTVYAGSTPGFMNGIGTNAQFYQPYGIVFDSTGNLYVADSLNSAIRLISPPRDIYNYDTLAPVNIYNYNTVVTSSILTVSSNVYVNSYVDVYQSATCPCCTWTSPIRGNMLTWSNLPVSTIYNSFFYGINPPDLLNELNIYEQQKGDAVSSLQLCLDTIISLSNTTLSSFVTLCNMNSSTISSYSSNLQYDTALSIERYNTINTTYRNTSTVAANMMSMFFTETFPRNATNLLRLGNFYYLQRPPNLIRPIPWFWQGQPPRFVGSGLSSMYTSSLCNAPLMASYLATLSNTSTSWVASNSIIQQSISNYGAFTTMLINGTDTGSSISSLFSYSNSSFINYLPTYFYGDDVSTISTFVTTYFTNYITPTDGPYISTGASSMFYMNSTLNSTLLSYVSSGTLGDPLSTFSTIVDFELTTLATTAYDQANIGSLSTLNSNLSTTIIPVLNLLSLSTNVAGYQSLSTLYPTLFSSVSTFYNSTVPYNLISNILYDASTLMSTAFAFSSLIFDQRNSILGLDGGAGASSLSKYLSTTISTSYVDYSSQISSLSTLLQVSTAGFQTQLRAATAYYTAIKPMLYYSTSRFQYMLRSTSFTAIEVRSTINLSTLSVSTLGVRAATANEYSFATQGAVNILQSNLNQASLLLSNFNVYASDTLGSIPRNTLVAQLSSIVFNSTFTIKRLYNSTLTGLIGINTSAPAYALDIGAGDARKTGTTWLNPSDERIKDGIVTADGETLLQEISSLRLVSYMWSEPYRASHALTTDATLGFISQDVEAVFPQAVTATCEEGFSDFRSLNTDQIMKAKFGLTQFLLSKFSTLESRLNNLM